MSAFDAFPGKFSAVIANRFMELQPTIFPDHYIYLRGLRSSDPSGSISVVAANWRPEPESMQIGQDEPAINRYLVRLQNIVRHMDEAEGVAQHSADCKLIRLILYRDESLRVQLRALSESLMGRVETVSKVQVLGQDYLSSQLTAEFYFYSTTDLLIETTTVGEP